MLSVLGLVWLTSNLRLLLSARERPLVDLKQNASVSTSMLKHKMVASGLITNSNRMMNLAIMMTMLIATMSLNWEMMMMRVLIQTHQSLNISLLKITRLLCLKERELE